MYKFGSNQLRKKMNHIPALGLSKTRVTEPIIKGRDYKPREKKVDLGKEGNVDKDKGKIKRESKKLDESYE